MGPGSFAQSKRLCLSLALLAHRIVICSFICHGRQCDKSCLALTANRCRCSDIPPFAMSHIRSRVCFLCQLSTSITAVFLSVSIYLFEDTELKSGVGYCTAPHHCCMQCAQLLCCSRNTHPGPRACHKLNNATYKAVLLKPKRNCLRLSHAKTEAG